MISPAEHPRQMAGPITPGPRSYVGCGPCTEKRYDEYLAEKGLVRPIPNPVGVPRQHAGKHLCEFHDVHDMTRKVVPRGKKRAVTTCSRCRRDSKGRRIK